MGQINAIQWCFDITVAPNPFSTVVLFLQQDFHSKIMCFHYELKAAESSVWLMGTAQLGMTGKVISPSCLPSFCCMHVKAVPELLQSTAQDLDFQANLNWE